MQENLTAVCISRQQEDWKIDTIPFYCYTEDWKPFGREKTRERVEYLATRRNEAVKAALARFPETNHILMIDSYYVRQPNPVRILIEEYDGRSILGATTWVLDKTRIISRNRFWDNWTTPELAREVFNPYARGRIRVRAAGGCYVYPRKTWELFGYGVPEDLHGCEHNYLCERSGLPVFVTMNARLWRQPIIYPWAKRIRRTIHAGRILRTSSRT
jgi:hypothetical protein